MNHEQKPSNRPRHCLVILVASLICSICFSLPAAGSIVCRSCGAESADEALYCQACGKSLTRPEAVFCSQCGVALPSEADFCSGCGHAIRTAEKDEARRPTKPIQTQTTNVRSKRPNAADQLGAYLGRRNVVFPPRLLDLPTGAILPSLAVHAHRGWAFGLSDHEEAHRWAFSFGLGGVSEAIVSSSRIIHIAEPQSNALGGFRVRLPVRWLGDEAAGRLKAALNLATTAENGFHSPGTAASSDGTSISNLSYNHRETTLGLSASWNASPVRLHGTVHATDMRAENLQYWNSASSKVTIADRQITSLNFGIGLDYDAREDTRLMAEIRTAPHISLAADTGELSVKPRVEGAVGLRFFPIRALGLDAQVSVDEDASGLADLEIGAGMHLMLAGE